MARVSAFSTLDSIFCKPISHSIPSHSLKIPVRVRTHYFQSHAVANSFKHWTLLDNRTKKKSKTSTFYGIRRLRSVGEETQIPEEETEQQEAQLQEQGEQQTVSVPVSPSDTLTMHFQAEGTMSETAIPSVTAALKEVEGITDLKVKVLEGIASVELIKQTTVQATGVASSLVEIIQGSGFKLQTLNLSFEDEEDLVAL